MPRILQREVLTLEDVWDELVYSEARLRHDENAKDLTADISKLCDKVLEVRLGQLNAWKAETFAQAGIFGANFMLDAFTVKFERSVRRSLEDAEVKEPTKDPRYTTYFPEAISRTIGRALNSQLEVTKPMLVHLRMEKTPEVSAHLPTMEALYSQGAAAIDEQQRAEAARRNHRTNEIVAIFEEANSLRKSIYGTLTTREAERRQPSGWADSFFRKQSRATDDPLELKQDAILLVLKARGVSLSKENQKKIFEATDAAVLDRWLSLVGTVASEAELFA